MSQEALSQTPESEKKSHFRFLISLILAIILGSVVGGWFPKFAIHTTILGEIFLNALKMVVVPLVIFSMLVGVTALGDVRHMGAIGGRVAFYFLSTTFLSVILGIILVNLIQPGKGILHGEEHPDWSYRLEGDLHKTLRLIEGKWLKTNYNTNHIVILQDQKMKGVIESITENSIQVKFWESERDANAYYVATENGPTLSFRTQDGTVEAQLPSPKTLGKGVKIYLAVAKKVKGKETKSATETIREVFLGDSSKNKEGLIPQNLFNAMVNMDLLPLIFFSLLFGAAISTLGPRAKGVVDGFSVLNDAIMKIVQWIMVVAPIGIFGLIAGRIGSAGGFSGFWPELVAVGKYCLTVVLGLAIHGIIVLPALLFVFGKRNPMMYFKGMMPALLNAFSTASSSATIPLTMEGVEKENGISNRTASFVVPLGATVNMDGTALYEAVAAIFIAQVYGVPLPLSAQIIIVLTATLASIGAAGIPEAGLVTMVIVLRAVDLPVEGIGLLLAVDWLLDRFRTTVNVWGDAIGSGIIETFENRATQKEKT